MERKHEHQHGQDCGCEKNHSQDCQCGGERGCDCGCGCKCGGHFQRQYQTREEQISELENYLKDLKLEVQAVEERLQELRK